MQCNVLEYDDDDDDGDDYGDGDDGGDDGLQISLCGDWEGERSDAEIPNLGRSFSSSSSSPLPAYQQEIIMINMIRRQTAERQPTVGDIFRDRKAAQHHHKTWSQKHSASIITRSKSSSSERACQWVGQ